MFVRTSYSLRTATSMAAPSTCSSSNYAWNRAYPDFGAQRILPQRFCATDARTQLYLKEFVADNRIVLFMKGNPTFPQCGFSRVVTEVLRREGVGENDFVTVDVLEHPHIREGVKEFSDWPTIPQLYINGEFIGGCDIVIELYKSGELKDILAK